MVLLLLACTPLVSGPTPVPLPAGRTGEVGGALFGGVYPGVDSGGLDVPLLPAAGGTFWGRYELANGIGVGGRLDIGTPQLGSGGFWIKLGIVRRHRSALGIQADMGLLYGELSFPSAFRLGTRWWVWTRPGARAAQTPVGFLPMGVCYEPSDTTALHAEVTTLAPFGSTRAAREVSVGLVASFGWGIRF